MNYKKTEMEPLVELHKTDYNNYADLSHFVDEYYKAQALINECNNFYRSFLKSKLLPYYKIAGSAYSQDKYRFFEYKLYESLNGYVNFIEEYPILNELQKNNAHKPWSGISNYVSIMGLAYLATTGATLKLKDEIDNDPNCMYELGFNTWRTDNYHSYDYFAKQWNNRTVPKYIIIKKDRNICIDLYGKLDMWKKENESDGSFKKRIKNAYKTIGISEDKLQDEMRIIRKNIEERWQNYCNDEMIRLFTKYDVRLQIKITNKLKTDAYHCYCEYKNHNKNTTELDKYKKYFSDESIDTLSISIKDFMDETTLNDILSQYKDGIGYWGYGPVETIIGGINREKLDKYICNKLEESSAIFREILMKYESNNDNQKLYIIDENNNAQYFCNTSELPLVNITLKDRELICTYTTEKRYKRYKFPSDCPWTVDTSTTQVIFNVSDNSVKSYKFYTSSHEESIKYRY